MQKRNILEKHRALVELFKKSIKTVTFAAALLVPFVSHAQTNAYTAALLSYGPLAYWPMNETNGDTAYDIANNPNGTNNGTYGATNDPGSFVLGQPGPGYLFGSNTSVSLNPPASLASFGGVGAVFIANEPNLNGTGPITIITWIQCTATGTFTTPVGNSDQSYHLDIDQNGYAHFADGNGAGDTAAVGTSAVNDGSWHQLVGVYDSVSNHIYVDGTLENSAACPTAPLGNSTSLPNGTDLMIGDSPEYYTGPQVYSGNICQVAIIPSALTASNVAALYNIQAIPACATGISHTPTGAPGDAPSTPVVYTGSVTLTATVTGSVPLSLQWYYLDTSGHSNNILGANSTTYTITGATPSLDGYQYGINAANADGTNSCGNPSVTLTVLDVIVVQSGGTLSPPTGEAYVGAPLTYTVFAGGDSPLSYQWLVDGVTVSGATSSTFTTPALLGQHTNQVDISSPFGLATNSASATYQGDASPTNITFASIGWNSSNWTLNGTAASYPSAFSSGILPLTDNLTPKAEVSSAFFGVPQYVGSFTASFIYQATGGRFGDIGAGACFIIQNAASGTGAIGDNNSIFGAGLGYYSTSSAFNHSAAFEISIDATFSTIGVSLDTNGETASLGGGPPFELTGSVAFTNADPILVELTYANRNLAVTVTDQNTPSLTYSTNMNLGGSLTSILNGTDLAYIGFSGAQGSSTLDRSQQTIMNFTFASLPPVTLALSPITSNSFILSWPAYPAGFALEQTTYLLGPWTLTPTTPTVVGGVNMVTTNYTGSSQMFYRLEHVNSP